MSEKPSKIWKELPADARQALAAAFWQDESGEDVQVQQAEAMMIIARRLNFRPKSVQALPDDKLAKLLAQMGDVSDAIATRALIAYHFQAQRPLMAAFLDALAIPHDNGLITAESVTPPETAAIAAATGLVLETFPADAVQLYLRTLKALDGDTWANLAVA